MSKDEKWGYFIVKIVVVIFLFIALLILIKGCEIPEEDDEIPMIESETIISICPVDRVYDSLTGECRSPCMPDFVYENGKCVNYDV